MDCKTIPSSAGHGVCASCVFINNSRGIGCSIELHNEKSGYVLTCHVKAMN